MTVHPEVSKFLSDIGKKGGASRSEPKIKASRVNGRLGGRPKKKKKVQMGNIWAEMQDWERERQERLRRKQEDEEEKEDNQ